MFLKELCILNYKNLETANLSFSSNLNCFSGFNGAGKTNILDAIYYMSVGKSSFTMTDRQCVRHTSPFFMLDGRFEIGGQSFEHIVCSYTSEKGKIIKRNDKEYSKLSDHLGLLPVVMVTPSDVSLIMETGEERRRYINHFLSMLDREYLGALVRYNGVLLQRNKLLKELTPDSSLEILEIINSQIATLGATIHQKRKNLIDALAPVVSNYYMRLSDDRECVELVYKSKYSTQEEILEALEANTLRDIINGHTSVGIHRDDVVMTIAGHPIRKYGSQGQQKSFIVALKLAQYDIIKQKMGVNPILLLDDVFDKLDGNRVKNLVRMVSEHKFGQIFITDSNKVRLDTLLEDITDERALFNVDAGSVTI